MNVQALPDDIQQRMYDMVYARRHNNCVSTYGFLIVIDVAFDTKIDGTILDQLDAYVYEIVSGAHEDLDPDKAWFYVSNVRVDQWEWVSGDEDDLHLRENRYQVCLRIGDRQSSPPLFPYSTRDGRAMHAKDLLERFKIPPVFVEGVFVSGVDETTIRNEWAECIAKVANTFDRPGGGYKQHPMMILPERGVGQPDAWKTKEHSWRFNWPEYPGARGADW